MGKYNATDCGETGTALMLSIPAIEFNGRGMIIHGARNPAQLLLYSL
jgi:hypothetical protein